jgi:hypothetical protein
VTLAQPELPELGSDTLLEDPESDDFEDDIFFDDFDTETSSTTDTTTDVTDTTAAAITVADTATGADTNMVFSLTVIMTSIALLILKAKAQRPNHE